MEYKINDKYYYDSDRMIIFSEECDRAVIRNISGTNPYHEESERLKRSKYSQRNLEHGIVQKAGIILSYNCGLRCNYCSQSSDESHATLLSLHDIEVFVSDIIKKRIVAGFATKKRPELTMYFTGGGEATYNWYLFQSTVEMIQEKCAAANVSLTLEMTTNGMLNDQQRFFIAQHFTSALVSYDGLPGIQDQNRKTSTNQNTHPIVEESIRFFIENGVRTTIRTTLWQNDFDKLEAMGEWMMRAFPGLEAWDINPVTPAGRAVDIMQNENFSQFDFLSAFISLKDKMKTANCAFDITSPLLSCEPVGFNCGGISSVILEAWLLPDKRIISCIDSTEFYTQIGEIQDGFVQYWSSYDDPLLDAGVNAFEKCRDCVAFRVCGGGCPIKHARENKYKTGMMEWECNMERGYWSHVLNRLSQGDSYQGWRSYLHTDNSAVYYQLTYENQ